MSRRNFKAKIQVISSELFLNAERMAQNCAFSKRKLAYENLGSGHSVLLDMCSDSVHVGCRCIHCADSLLQRVAGTRITHRW